MKTNLKRILAVSIIAVFVLAGCNKHDDNTPKPQTLNLTPTMNIKVNGINYVPTSVVSKITITKQGGKSLDIIANFNNDQQIVLSVANNPNQNSSDNGIAVKKYDTDFSGPNTICTEISGTTYCDYALGVYLLSNKSFYSNNVIKNTGVVDITSVDEKYKVVSGKFSFKVTDKSKSIVFDLDGDFANQPYTINK